MHNARHANTHKRDARDAHIPTHTCVHAHTHTYTDTRTHVKNLFPIIFCTSREFGDYGYLKIKGMANIWSAISRLQIDEIEKIQQGFEEYDFDFKIFNSATRITCFTCSTFLLLTASFLRIFDEIEKLEKNVVKVCICKSWGLYLKGASFCFNLLFFVSLGNLKLVFFCLKWSNSAKKIVQSPLKNEFEV